MSGLYIDLYRSRSRARSVTVLLKTQGSQRFKLWNLGEGLELFLVRAVERGGTGELGETNVCRSSLYENETRES